MAFLVGLGLPFMGDHLGLNNDDPACGPDLVADLGQSVQLQAATTVIPLQHCAICHLQRATSGAAPAARLDTLGGAGWTNARLGDDSRHVASTALDRQPARAPPASLLS